MHGAAKMNFVINLNNCCQTTFCSSCPAPSGALQTTTIKRISSAPAGEIIKCFLPFWETVCHYFSSPTVTLPCHGYNFLASQKPVADLHTEIIDLCNTSPSLFVIYIFPYNLNTVIVPLSILVLLLLYTVPSGLAGEISMIGFWFLITIKAIWHGLVSTKCKVQTFVHAPDQNSVALLHLRWII